MAKRDSNIDPFNAGEPVSPWQDQNRRPATTRGKKHTRRLITAIARRNLRLAK